MQLVELTELMVRMPQSRDYGRKRKQRRTGPPGHLLEPSGALELVSELGKGGLPCAPPPSPP